MRPPILVASSAMNGSFYSTPDTLTLSLLERVEGQLLDAVKCPETGLQLASDWESLLSTVTIYANNLSNEASSKLYAVAERESIVATGLLKMEETADALDLFLNSEIGRILDDIWPGESEGDVPNPTVPSVQTSITALSSDERDDDDDREELTTRLHDWLLAHLHNPYPTASVKQTLAGELGVSTKVINDWFTNHRRRIGWASICKRRFENDRFKMVDYAYRILVDNSTSQLPAAIVDEFLQMKDTAEHLLDGKVVQSDLVKTLDVASHIPPKTSPRKTSSQRGTKRLPSELSANSRKRLRRNPSETSNTSSFSSKLSSQDSDHEDYRRNKRSRSLASMVSRQPTLTYASSPSGASTPAPATPVLPHSHLNSAHQFQASSSQVPLLNTLIDDWLATLRTASPASPVDEIPSARASSKKRRNEDVDADEGESSVVRKKARVASESEASTATFDSRSEGFASEGLYPTSTLESFSTTIPHTDANTEALYSLTSSLALPQPAPQAVDDLFSSNEFCNIGSLGDGSLNLGLGLGLASSSIEDQPLEVGMGSYGFADLTSSTDLGFGFEPLPSASASPVDALGLQVGAGTDLASVLQQLHPTPQERHFEAPQPAPETIPLPVQGADEVAKLANPVEEEQLLTLALSEEEIAALAGCLDGNQLDLTGDVFGLAFDAPSTMCAPVTSAVMPSIDVESFERDAKLTRLQSLLAEVNQLQQEVFC
ncbi:hypothetical protein SCHPADRAFT_991979 [Schizopora paradoxa]|uniref:Homeobox domain-containing protein n=1 Tax=Schizopora paradoxa TaxID=27342 RepID=A0A0H2S9V6_9AGAM|nr:hypothetical protein SCHPADRAFT_991979 [Schizopora paradoxa]